MISLNCIQRALEKVVFSILAKKSTVTLGACHYIYAIKIYIEAASSEIFTFIIFIII